MIINSGWDFILLTKHLFNWEDGSRRLFVIEMNGELSYFATTEISSAYDGNLDGVAETILDTIDQDFIRYFALVEQCPQLPHPEAWINGSDWSPPTKDLEHNAAARGLHLVSHVFITDEEWNSTGPMHEFASYATDNELPRIDITRPTQYSETRMAGGETHPDNRCRNSHPDRDR